MTTMTVAVGTAHGAAIGGKAETAERVSVARNLLLFLAAPWIGLAYVVAFPFVGFAALVRAAILRR